MHIIFRVCERQDTLSYINRWENKDKLEIIRKVWRSLQLSVEPSDKISVLQDNCSEDTKKFLLNTSATDQIEIVDIPEHAPDVPEHYVFFANYLNDICFKSPEEIFYCCEDDYLHLPHALNVMKSLYQDGYGSFSVPYDYPDRYTLDRSRTCELFINTQAHWRTIPSSTATVMAPGKMWLKHIENVQRHAQYNDDGWSWKAFAQDMGVCPVPGLAAHLTPNHLSPFMDWQRVWDMIDIDG